MSHHDNASLGLRRSLLYRGGWRTLTLAARAVAFRLRQGAGARRPEAFDWEFGVATSAGDAPRGERKAAVGGVYGPVDTASFTALFRRGGIRASLAAAPGVFDFLDFGCGRGRALLLASEYRFGRVRGVEYDRALVESARGNIAIWLAHAPRLVRVRCRDLAVEWADAAAWPLPEPPRPTVFFLNEPVGEAALRHIAAYIRQSLTRTPRPAFVVYLGGGFRPAWEAPGDFAIVYTRGDDRVYRWRMPDDARP